MTNSQRNRRSFLSTIAILSAGAAFGSTIKQFSSPAINTPTDLKEKWAAFWKQAGGQHFNGLPHPENNSISIKGHKPTYGQAIFFPEENIVALPTWIFWENNRYKPADMIITLFESNESFKKIISLNRYEMDALYHLSKEQPVNDVRLTAFKHSNKTGHNSSALIKTKTNIKKEIGIQDISYFNGQMLVFKDKKFYHI
ncbi:MAG: hypothetical protein ABJB11_00780 [Ferruginibacter sp.]